MHRRKHYLVYPSGYKPGDGFKVRFSRRQAWKTALRMGLGSEIDVCIYTHDRRAVRWSASQSQHLWIVVNKGSI